MKLRLSKYNPKYRLNGKYCLHDWTSISDIGKELGWGRIGNKEYLKVESQYLNCICDLVLTSGTESMRIVSFEGNSRKPLLSALRMTLLLNCGTYFFRQVRWKEGQVLTLSEIKLFIMDSLREKCWGRLWSETIEIDVGYDYYVHLDTTLTLESIQYVVAKYGLYIDQIFE